MGIVIINGKRYDSVTGLMLSSDSNGGGSDRVQQSFDGQTPDWIASYVDEVKHETAATTHVQANVQAPEPFVSQTTVHTAADKAADTSSAATSMRTAAKAARRTVSTSNTLNRRFVKKPLAENGKYAESIAQHHIKLAQAAQRAATPVNIPEDTQLHAASEANEDFVPMLTRRQAESVNRLSNTEPLESRVAKAKAEAEQRKAATKVTTTTSQGNNITVKVKPAIRLTPAQQSVDADDVLNERLSQLSQILQNAKELDEQERSRKSAKKQTLTESLAKTVESDNRAESKHGRRKFRLSSIFATAGAVAVIAGLGIYVAMPTISVKMAASKAGLTTNTPYIPKGFTIDGEVASADGLMTINYRSKSGGDGYSVTIKENDSDTQGSLRNRIAELYSNGYRTEQSGDKTILRYGSKVTWLDDGLEYTINTNNYLDNDEISSIVDSL